MAQENYKTFDFTPYESNFATGRREELADRTKQEFDTNKAEYDILQRTIGSLETTDFNKKYVNQMNKDIEKKMEGVLQTGRYDLAGFGVADSLTRYMTDTTVKNAVESFQMIKKEDQVNAANPNKVHRYYEVPVMLDENQNEWTAADYKDPNKEGVAQLDANDNPVMKDLRQEHDAATGAYAGNSEEALDHVARATAMMKGIAKNSKFYTWIDAIANKYGVDEEEAARMIMTGEGVTRNRVEGLAEALVEEYGSTPEGLQRIQALSLKLSPNVEYYGKDPLMQLYSDEEIQQVLVNDLMAAGEPQIGETVDIRNIPQPAPSGTDSTTNGRVIDYSTNMNYNETLAAIKKANVITKKEIKADKSSIYDANGTLKMQTKSVPGPRFTKVKGNVPDPESLAKAYVRAEATLTAKGSNNPLDIEDEYERSVYINTQYDHLKRMTYIDDDGNPVEIKMAVSDAEFAYQIQQNLASAKSIQNTAYKPRVALSLEGTTSGAKLAATDIFENIGGSGTLIYDESINPEQGLDGAGYRKKVGDTEYNRFLTGLSNLIHGKVYEADDPVLTVEGLSLRPQSPGALKVSYTDEDENKKTLYVKVGELSQTMLKPAAGLIAIALDPLNGGKTVLPNIFLTEKELKEGKRTVLTNEIRSTGNKDGSNFSVKSEYFTYTEKQDVNGTWQKASQAHPVTQEEINGMLNRAVKTYLEYGPDQASFFSPS